MSNLEIISEIIDDKYLFSDQENILEKNFDKKGRPFEMKVRIVKSNTITHKLYRFESKDFPFFSEIKGLKKMCDFILFAEENNHLHIFLIELKLSPESAKKQLDAANEFALFILKSSKRIDKVINHFSIKKVRICQEFINKRNKMAMENSYNFDEKNFLDYKLKSFYLSHLIFY